MDTISWEWPIHNKIKFWGINDTFKPTNVFSPIWRTLENESEANNGIYKPKEWLQYSDVIIVNLFFLV